MTHEHKEAKREVGYKIDEVNDLGNEFEVYVLMPDQEASRLHFSFQDNDHWRTKREYVDDNGNVKEDYNWKIHIEKHIKKHYQPDDDEPSALEKADFSPEDFEGDKLDV